MRMVLASLALLCCLVLSSSLAFAEAAEISRGQSTVTIGQNIITADSGVKCGGYRPGEKITVTLSYSGTCNLVFSGLTLQPRPFAPFRGVTGEIANVRGTPKGGRAGIAGSAAFDITFHMLRRASTGEESGVARLDLVLGLDRDCDLATGDADGVDGPTTIGVQISVSTGP